MLIFFDNTKPYEGYCNPQQGLILETSPESSCACRNSRQETVDTKPGMGACVCVCVRVQPSQMQDVGNLSEDDRYSHSSLPALLGVSSSLYLGHVTWEMRG